VRGIIGLLFVTIAVLVFGGAFIAVRTRFTAWATSASVANAVMFAAIFLTAEGFGLVGEFLIKQGIGSVSVEERVLFWVMVSLPLLAFYGIRKVMKRLPLPAALEQQAIVSLSGPYETYGKPTAVPVSLVTPFPVKHIQPEPPGPVVPPRKPSPKKRAA
jgi:hypothetical protein